MSDETQTDTVIIDRADLDAARIEELEEQLRNAEGLLAEKEEALAEAEALVDVYKPTVDVSDFITDDPEVLKARFTTQQLKDIAAAELIEINRARRKTGLEPITYSDEEWETQIELAVADMLNDKNVPEGDVVGDGPMLRMLKVVKGNPAEGVRVTQIPYEGQINNANGSLADAWVRYENKGFKRATVEDDDGNVTTFCPAKDCWRPAAVAGGEYEFAGYCTPNHRQRVEGHQRNVSENAITAGRTRG